MTVKTLDLRLRKLYQRLLILGSCSAVHRKLYQRLLILGSCSAVNRKLYQRLLILGSCNAVHRKLYQRLCEIHYVSDSSNGSLYNYVHI